MGSANLIDWSLPSVKAVYEPMIAVLISRLNPEARRIDGSGGDGGRDVQVKLGDRLEIYELKSFHGRLADGGRKAQIARSLKNAATHSPTAWYLIAPLDLTPGEEEWFDDLVSQYPFPCYWHGELWLNSHMALLPDIPRYFLHETSHEVLTLLRELQAEKAAFNNGLADAIDRLRTLAARFNAENPFYGFSFSCEHDGSVSTRVKPRYVGAEQDCPISITPHFDFPGTEAGRDAAAALKATFDYGSASDIPAEFVKQVIVEGLATLEGAHDSSGFRFESIQIDGVDGLRLRAQITSPDGAILSSLPMAAQTGTRGGRGVVINLMDFTGALTLELKVDVTGERMQLQYEYSHAPHTLPAALVPVARFIESLCKPNRLQILDRQVPLGPPMVIPADFQPTASAAARLCCALAEIQEKTGVYFPLPEAFTSAELEEVAEAHALITGGTATGTWKQWSAEVTAEFLRSEVGSTWRAEKLTDFFRRDPLILTLAGDVHVLGLVRTDFASARVVKWPPTTPNETPDTKLHLDFEPFDDAEATQRFEPHGDGMSAEVGHPGSEA